ncbi:MAG: DEAD/DEAH box helicase [Armatimonadetes bacterium]|nr:DEAD/DEAH box helicase [Armatimonadota bacterium]
MTFQPQLSPSPDNAERPIPQVGGSPEKRYLRLDVGTREVLQLLSALYDFIHTDSLKALAGRLPSQMAPHQLPSALSRAEAAGFVERHDQGRRGVLVRCRRPEVEWLSRRAVSDGVFAQAAELARRVLPKRIDANLHWLWADETDQIAGAVFRDLRLALYSRRWDEVAELANLYEEYATQVRLPNCWLQLVEPFDGEWLAKLPRSFRDSIAGSLLDDSLVRLKRQPEFELWIEKQAGAKVSLGPLWVDLLALQGRWSQAEAFVAERPAIDPAPRALLEFLQGGTPEASQRFEAFLKDYRKEMSYRNAFPAGALAGPLYLVHLLGLGDANSLDKARRQARNACALPSRLRSSYHALGWLAEVLGSGLGPDRLRLRQFLEEPTPEDGFGRLFRALAVHVSGAPEASGLLDSVADVAERAARTGYRWIEQEARALAARLGARGTCPPLSHRPLVERIGRNEPWKLSLQALLKPLEGAEARADQRIAWWVAERPGGYSVEPRLQKKGRAEGWTRGTKLSLKKFATEELRCLAPEDLRVRAAVRERERAFSDSVALTFDDQTALLQLIGHPRVFWADQPDTRIELIEGLPTLRITRKKGRILVHLSEAIPREQPVIVERDGPSRLRICRVTEAHRHIAAVLGQGLEVPDEEEGVGEIRRVITGLAGLVTVHSDVRAAEDSVETVAADPRPCFQLCPAGQGLRIRLAVRPLGISGPALAPGSGGQTLLAELKGARAQTNRNLGEERRLAREAVAACPTLIASAGEDTREWQVEDLEACLELLDELKAQAEAVVLEWPQGETLKIRHRASLQSMRLRIRETQDWFSIQGELELDESTVIEVSRILELLDQSGNRFLPMGDGQFLALSDSLRRRLHELKGHASEVTRKGLRLHPMAALSLGDIVEGVGSVQGARSWRAHLERLEAARNLEFPVPATLQAELRDYQREGCHWLARLAELGVGACLADDMGLGKTVQALALLLSRAADGPHLIVAPTSVCSNWVQEIRRFAPTLRPIVLAEVGRQEALQKLQPRDVMICSYGLLVQEVEALSQVSWEGIVLDEAQAIKNKHTKRFLAAVRLEGRFRVATTGTPIENHLGELWSLFRFLNPGLLGSLESFNRRFAGPIERAQDAQARQLLRRRLRPLILRRTKAQVLDELPARTDIVIRVELKPEERAVYEAARRRAVEAVEASEGEPQPMRILAELMRLRRLCCHPRLVYPESDLTSSKLTQAERLLDDLLENRHRALVFSQFVGHLSLVRERLEAKGISYQYLDGSTPARERQKRVDAFQAGVGDVFLISLKAGGLGLNLTGADYVLHLDPWWNPAVEDQAADRAHRLGQTRPVTVYRLVCAHTIEEKIVELHRTKRDLADGLLEGTDGGGRLSTEELLRLLREL